VGAPPVAAHPSEVVGCQLVSSQNIVQYHLYTSGANSNEAYRLINTLVILVMFMGDWIWYPLMVQRFSVPKSIR